MREESALFQLCSCLCLTVWIWVSHTSTLCFNPPISPRGVLASTHFWSGVQFMTESAMPEKPICVSADSFVALLGSSGEMGDPGRSSSAGKPCLCSRSTSVPHSTHTPASCPQVAPAMAFLKCLEQPKWQNMLVNASGVSIISSQ